MSNPVEEMVSPTAVAAVGVDLQVHADVAQSLDRFGESYLRRVLGPHELTERPVTGGSRWVAGRFAAKEAVFKTLAIRSDEGLAWSGIEILRGPTGGPTVHLGDRAHDFALRHGLIHLDVSITHTAAVSAACAVGTRHIEEPRLHHDTTKDESAPVARHLNRKMNMADRATLENQIREVLAEQGHLTQDAGSIGVEDNLYTAGMSSHASVNLMLGLEDELDIEFPEDKLTKQTFSTISAIADAIEEIVND